jgi:hypothetical protein
VRVWDASDYTSPVTVSTKVCLSVCLFISMYVWTCLGLVHEWPGPGAHVCWWTFVRLDGLSCMLYFFLFIFGSTGQGAGHPCGVVYSLDVLLSGWEDGSLRYGCVCCRHCAPLPVCPRRATSFSQAFDRTRASLTPGVRRWAWCADANVCLLQVPPLRDGGALMDSCGWAPRWHDDVGPQWQRALHGAIWETRLLAE